MLSFLFWPRYVFSVMLCFFLSPLEFPYAYMATFDKKVTERLFLGFSRLLYDTSLGFLPIQPIFPAIAAFPVSSCFSLWDDIFRNQEFLFKNNRQKAELPYDPSIPLPRIYQKKTETLTRKDTCAPMFNSSAIHNSQGMDATHVSLNRWMDKEDKTYMQNGILFSYKKGRHSAICTVLCAMTAGFWYLIHVTSFVLIFQRLHISHN